MLNHYQLVIDYLHY